jgi:MYXO-CTERM domain-containing protein
LRQHSEVSVSHEGDGPLSPSRLKTALLALLLLGLAAALGALATTGAGAAAWVFAALALLCCSVLAAALGYQWAAVRLGQALREARAAQQAQATLIDLWQWQTDREHHLVRL